MGSKETFNEPVTTLHDEDGRYPFFSNPNHIRSIKSLHDYSSLGSPQTNSHSSQKIPPIISSKNAKGPGQLINSSAKRD